ncbi:MAG: 2Fe-2S iron-sulfur cluster-binding protein [Actinomycetota bacterium]
MAPVHQVTILPADVSFDCSEEETILDAAVRRGFALPYGCKKGNCGTCKAQVLDGEVDLEIESTYSLSDFERQQGFTLLCSAYAVCDTTVEMEGLDASDLADVVPPPGDFLAEVLGVRQLTRDIRGLELALDGELEFRSGMFAQVNAPDTDIWRSYSMANPASRRDRLEFMIKLVPGGLFSARLEAMEPGDKLRVNAPHGTFWIRDRDRPLLMIGGGAGMAPLWGMLQDLAERGDPRPVRFFYGARTPDDLFNVDEIAALGERLPDFEFVPALSHVGPEDANGHECGLITDIVERRIGSDIGDHDAYLCGPPPMIDAALRVLEAHGLEERKSIHYDKFTAS